MGARGEMLGVPNLEETDAGRDATSRGSRLSFLRSRPRNHFSQLMSVRTLVIALSLIHI